MKKEGKTGKIIKSNIYPFLILIFYAFEMEVFSDLIHWPPSFFILQDVVVVNSSEELITASVHEQPNQINQPISRVVEIGIQNMQTGMAQPLYVKLDSHCTNALCKMLDTKVTEAD